MRDQNADDVEQATDIFRMCLQNAENAIEERNLADVKTDTIVTAAAAMMGFIATTRHGKDVGEIASIATSIDGKDFS